MDLTEWILDGCAHSIAWIHILCMSFINMSHILDEFWECKWSRYLACYAEHRIMKINHMLDHHENANSSFGRTKQLLSCLPMSIGIYRKRMCRRKRHLRICSGSSILKHPSLLLYSFFFCLSWFTEPLSFFKCYSENKNLYCSPLHFRTYWSTTCMRKEKELGLISRSGYRIRICIAICEFPFQNPFTEKRRRNIYIGCQSKKVEIIYVPHLGTIPAYCTTGLWYCSLEFLRTQKQL